MTSRIWATGYDDKQLLTLLDFYREEGKTFREIADILGHHNYTTILRWYNRRTKTKLNVQKALRDFGKRLQMLEERNARMIPPPPPPPDQNIEKSYSARKPRSLPNYDSKYLDLQAELKKTVKDFSSLLDKVNGEVKGAHWLETDRLDSKS